MKAIPFNVDHLHEVGADIPCFSIEQCAHLAENSFTFTIVDKQDRIVLVFGMVPMWKGVLEIWTLTNPDLFAKNIIGAHRVMERLRDMIATQYGAHRIQLMVRASTARYGEFMERFGFKSEGLMQKYGPNGEDFVRYACLR